MTKPDIPQSRWLGIEAARRGLPVLIRLQVFDRLLSEFPELLVMTWNYSPDEPSQLPPAAFYSALARFEREAVDPAERTQQGVLVAVETGLGVARQFYYTKSAQALASEFDPAIPADSDVEFSSERDPSWKEHERFLRMAGLGAE